MKDLEALTLICGKKVAVERKGYLNLFEMYCKEECNGYKEECPKYLPIKVSQNHYLVKRVADKYFDTKGDI